MLLMPVISLYASLSAVCWLSA